MIIIHQNEFILSADFDIERKKDAIPLFWGLGKRFFSEFWHFKVKSSSNEGHTIHLRFHSCCHHRHLCTGTMTWKRLAQFQVRHWCITGHMLYTVHCTWMCECALYGKLLFFFSQHAIIAHLLWCDALRCVVYHSTSLHIPAKWHKAPRMVNMTIDKSGHAQRSRNTSTIFLWNSHCHTEFAHILHIGIGIGTDMRVHLLQSIQAESQPVSAFSFNRIYTYKYRFPFTSQLASHGCFTLLFAVLS